MTFDSNIDDRVYTQEKTRLLYGSTPMFMISAEKPDTKQSQQDYLNRYWSSAALEWSVSCLKEHSTTYKTSYKKLFKPYLNDGMKKVLDVGTGSGFLAMLFAEEGYDVTGIDMSNDMLEQAEYCANKLGVKASFIQANTENLPFEDETFDLIVCRNVTWIFQDPEKAFREWNRVLVKGGRILYIDANWYLYQHDMKDKERFEDNRRKATDRGQKKLYGNGHSSTALIDNLSRDLPFSKIRRPEWDREHLSQLGFEVIEIRENITAEVCDEVEILRTEATPMFIVCAEKNL
jgi:ubiquinone/menaquinone biosynthesis C-methylase UbiE